MHWLSNERKDTSFHIMSRKDKKSERKLVFDILKFKFQNGLKQKTSNLWNFFETNRSVGALQILNPGNNAEILAPELIGGQSEMVV